MPGRFRRRRGWRSCNGVLLAAAALGCGAAEPPPLETVVVTAARHAQPLAEVPYAIAVLDERDFERRFARNLPEALTQLPGVSVQKTANGQGSPFLRGFTGYRTLTLIDGVRYNNAVYRDGPNEYFSLIDSYAIDRVELLAGPASVLYGSDAIGGTLNLETRGTGYDDAIAGAAYTHGEQRVRFASAEHSRQSRTELRGGVGGAWGVRAGYSLKAFGDVEAADLGKQFATGYSERAFDARVDVALDPDWRFTSTVQHLAQDDVWRTHATVFGVPFAGTAVGSDRVRLKDQSRHLAYARLEGTLQNGWIDRARLTLSHQHWMETGLRVRAAGVREREAFKSNMLGVDLEFESHLGGHRFVYGVDAYRDHIDSTRVDTAGGRDRIRVQGPIGDDATYTLVGAYAQWETTFARDVVLLAGTRYTGVAARVGRFEDPLTGAASAYADDWGEFVNSIRVSVPVGAPSFGRIWGGLSQSFRAPNIADVTRFGASRSNEIEIAATGLDAETFVTLELGYRYTGAKTRLEASIYRTEIDDFITSTPTGRNVGDQTEVTKRNSSSGFVNGVELSASHAWTPTFDTWANVTWLESRLERPATSAAARRITEPLSRTMPLTTHFGARWRRPDDRLWGAVDCAVVATADALSEGDRADRERIPPGGTPAYTVVTFTLGARLNRHLDATLQIANAFDESYRSHGSGSNEPGVGVNLGLRATF